MNTLSKVQTTREVSNPQSSIEGLVKISFMIFLAMGLVSLIAPLLFDDVPSSAILWVFLSLFFFIQGIMFFQRRRNMIGKSRNVVWLIFFYILCIWRIAQIAWSPDEIETAKVAIKTMILGAFVFLIHYNLDRISILKIKRYLTVMVVTLLTASLVVYGWLLFQFGDLSLYGSKLFKPVLVMFGGSNTAGAIVLLLGLANWIILLSTGRNFRLIGAYNVFVTLILLGGIASYSALTGYMASILVLLLFFLWRSKRKLFVPAVVLVFLAFSYISSSEITLIPSFDFGKLRTFYQRIDLWSEGWLLAKEGAWLLGLGAGVYGETATLDFSTPIRGGAHNALLQSLIEGGIVEVVLHLGLYVWLLVIAIKTQYKYRAIFLAFVTAVFIRNFAESNGILFGLINNYSIFLSWFVVIVLQIIARKVTIEKLTG